MLQPGRKYEAGSRYRYGFNGKENDNDVKGEGNQQDYGMRIYDPRLGKFLSVDPLTKQYPYYTPYQFAGNKPILFIDRDGAEEDDRDRTLESKIPQIKKTFETNISALPQEQQDKMRGYVNYAMNRRNILSGIIMDRWLTSRLMTRWMEGKGGYDILSYNAVNSLTFNRSVGNVKKELLGKVKEYASSLKEGSYSYTAFAQFDRTGSDAQNLLSDVATALGSYKILGRADANITVDKNGSFSIVVTNSYTLADKYQWKVGGGESELVDHDKMLELEKIGAKSFYVRAYFEQTFREKMATYPSLVK